MDPLYIIVGLLLVWTLVLSYLQYRIITHYRSLTKRTSEGSLDEALSLILRDQKVKERDIVQLKKLVDELDKDRHSYLQKFGFVKFNPFNDRVAGEQSFVVALLDNKGNGFLKTFLYTRDGVRVYIKQIENGKAKDVDLSEEEKEAIRTAS